MTYLLILYLPLSISEIRGTPQASLSVRIGEELKGMDGATQYWEKNDNLIWQKTPLWAAHHLEVSTCVSG